MAMQAQGRSLVDDKTEALIIELRTKLEMRTALLKYFIGLSGTLTGGILFAILNKVF